MLNEIKNPDDNKEIIKKSTEIVGNVGRGLKEISPYIPNKKVQDVAAGVGKGAEVAAKLKNFYDLKKQDSGSESEKKTNL
ncbi:MAG: hypothetical protein IJJ69_10330 [Oscillospiraceae bacterium]|nr:hypothetical protein [Oscillospiraceae bacterium]